jgi:host factor-I protein
MAQATESRTASSSAQPNIQDVFLNFARREKLSVNIHLLDGRQFDARIKNFDRFAVIVEVNGTDHLVFKHAIATIATQRSVANYFPSHHP